MRLGMKIYVASLVLLGFLFVGCNDAEKEGYLAEIQAMEEKLDSLSVRIVEHDSDNLRGLTTTINQVIGKVQKNYFPDSIDLEIAARMNAYKGIRKSLERNSGNLAKAKVAIPEIKEALGNLKHDIENGAGNRDQYAENVSHELGKVRQVEELLTFYFSTRDENVKTFEEIHPIVEAFADELEQKRQQELND